MTAKLESESKLLSAARDALSLEPIERDVLGPMQAEITDLREVSLGGAGSGLRSRVKLWGRSSLDGAESGVQSRNTREHAPFFLLLFVLFQQRERKVRATTYWKSYISRTASRLRTIHSPNPCLFC